MTNNREGLSYHEWKELKEAADSQFRTGEITETEYRMKLATIGLNATEIDEEVTGIENELD